MKKRKLNQRQKLFAKELIKGKSQGDAYAKVYKSKSSAIAQANASRLLAEKPEIKQYIVEIMERKGLGAESLVGKLKKLTSAKKDVVLPSGELIEIKDNTTRLGAVRDGLKMIGALSPNQISINRDERSINIALGEKSPKELNSLIQKLSELNKALALDNGAQDGEITDADFSSTDDTINLD